MFGVDTPFRLGGSGQRKSSVTQIQIHNSFGMTFRMTFNGVASHAGNHVYMPRGRGCMDFLREIMVSESLRGLRKDQLVQTNIE